MPAGSSPRRKRQHAHTKDSAKEPGASAVRAKVIASRTINKEWARACEAQRASKASAQGERSASPRRASPSHRSAVSPTRDQLHEEARKHNIHGCFPMNKQQPHRALGN